MKAAVMEAPAPAAPALGALEQLPLAALRESPWNPRHYFSPAAQAELVAAIRARGVTTPLIVRPSGGMNYEVGAGARRLRAAFEAGLSTVPCIVRELDDAAFLELVSFENGQRADPHPLDEAAGLQNYIERTGCAVEVAAAKAGVSKSQVYARLKLADLAPEAAQACWDGKITAGHAILLARLEPPEQKKGLAYCLSRYRTVSVRDLQAWIEDEFCLEMARAPFDLADAALVPADRRSPAPGPCTTCPKRTANNPDLYPELQPGVRRADAGEPEPGEAPDPLDVHDRVSADVCTDPGCFSRKVKAHLVEVRQRLAAEAKEFVEIRSAWGGSKKDGGALGRERYERVKAGDKGSKPALCVDGDDVGKVVHVRVKPAPAQAHEESRADYERKQAAQRQAAEREGQIRLRILKAIGAKVTRITRADLVALLSNVVDLDPLAELHGVKSGHQLQERLPKMPDLELARLVCEAGVSDDLGDIWRMDQKPEELLAAAARYKVDAAKIRREAEAAFAIADGRQKAAALQKQAARQVAKAPKAKSRK